MKNKIFRIDINKIKKNFIPKKFIQNFDKDGVIVLENVLSKNNCEKLIKLLEKNYKKYNNFYFKDKKISKLSSAFSAKELSNLHNKDFEFCKLIDNKKILPFIKKILQEGSYKNNGDIICQDFGARTPLGRCDAQQIHNDSRIVGLKFPIMVNTIWALDPFTKKNGSTRFVLGSHKLLKFPQNGKKYKNEIIIEAPTGSVVFFNSSVWHGGSSIEEKVVRRWSILIRYARWFYKPSFDFLRNTPRKIFNKMSSQQKDLLGFRFVPPIDEFKANSTRQKDHQKPQRYDLPKPY